MIRSKKVNYALDDVDMGQNLSVAGRAAITGNVAIGGNVAIDGQMGVGGQLDASGGVVGSLSTGASGTLKVSVGSVDASGSTQANAIANAAITKVFTLATNTDNAKGIALPAAVAGDVRIVKSGTAGSTVQVYPQVNAAINALGANNAYNTAAVGSVAFIAYNTTQWYTIPLAG